MVSEVWDLLDRTFVPKIASRSGRAAVDYRQIGIRPVARYSHAQERVGRQHKQSLQPFGTGKGVIEGHRIKSIRRRLGLTQKALAEAMKVDQGTISRWERGVEAPRPGRQAMLEKLLDVQDEHLALARARAFVRQDLLPSTLLDAKMRLIEMSASARRHFLDRGYNPETLIGKSLDQLVLRESLTHVETALHASGLLRGEAIFFRFVRNHKGKAHSTIYEAVFQAGQVAAVLNYVTAYFDLPKTDGETIELIEAVPRDDPGSVRILYRGPNADAAIAAVRGLSQT
jgi:transcriptional regulator with XRE-family HTH domain